MSVRWTASLTQASLQKARVRARDFEKFRRRNPARKPTSSLHASLLDRSFLTTPRDFLIHTWYCGLGRVAVARLHNELIG